MVVSVSDIVKVLEKIPDWARLKKLPNRVEELETRIAELESRLTAGGGHPNCKYCDKGAMQQIASEPREEGPEIAVRLETWRCQECGAIDHRVAPPK